MSNSKCFMRFGGEIFDCIGGMTYSLLFFTWEAPGCIAYALLGLKEYHFKSI